MQAKDVDPAMEAARAQLRKRRPMTDQDRRKEQVANEGVKQSIYLGYIHRELSSESACLELPLTIIILLSFSVLAMELLRQDKVFSVEEAIEFDIVENANFAWAHNFGHKGIVDVNSFADFWSWIRLGWLPLIVQPSWSYSEDYPAALGSPAYEGTAYGRPTGPSQWLFKDHEKKVPIKNDYLRYHRIIGGIRMAQTISQTVSPDSCMLPTTIDRKLMQAWLGKPCMPSDKAVLTPQKLDAENFDDFERVQWLMPELDSLEEMTRVLMDMEDGCGHATAMANMDSCRCTWCKTLTPSQPWLDELTSRVEIAFIVYNAQYGLYSYIGTNFYFNRAGHIHKDINIMSAWAGVFNRPTQEVLSIMITGTLWLLSMVYVFINETREVVHTVRASKERCWKAIKEDYLGVWNIVDWISLFVGAVLVVLYGQFDLSVREVNGQFSNMMSSSVKARTPGAIPREDYQQSTESFYAAVESMCLQEKQFRIGLFLYPSILMLRLFKTFAAQPRLAIVTLTLQRAFQDLIHFSIVFFCVYMCLVVNSILFFGQDLEDFSTLPRAINSCFRATFGDWDFHLMADIGLLKAVTWFWCLLLIVVLILLNMLLAVIMDAYTEEKERTKSAQTLTEQSWDMFRRHREFRRGERVRLNDIWDVFEKEYDGDVKRMLKDERMIKVSYLTEHVRHLQPKQAKRTLESALERHEENIEREKTQEFKLKEIHKFANHSEARISLILKELAHIVDRVKYYDRLQAPGDPEWDFHFGTEGRTTAEASQDAVRESVSSLSQEICGHFVDNLKNIEGWQDSFEKQQNELHGLVAEMQIMVRQQAWCVAAMSEAVAQLGVADRAAVAAAAEPGIT